MVPHLTIPPPTFRFLLATKLLCAGVTCLLLSGCQHWNLQSLSFPQQAVSLKPAEEAVPESEILDIPLKWQEALNQDRWTRQLPPQQSDLLEQIYFQPVALLTPRWSHAGWHEQWKQSAQWSETQDIPEVAANDHTSEETEENSTPELVSESSPEQTAENVQPQGEVFSNSLTLQQSHIDSLLQLREKHSIASINAAIILIHDYISASTNGTSSKPLLTYDQRMLLNQRLAQFLKSPQRTTTVGETPKPVSKAMQKAAAEALVLNASFFRSQPLEERFAAVGHLVNEAQLLFPVKLEMVRTLAPWFSPDRLPDWAEIKYDAPPEVLNQLADCYLIHETIKRTKPPLLADSIASQEQSSSDWMWGLRWSQNPSARKRFGQWLAITHHPQALEILRNQQKDHSAIVKLSAIESLGLLPEEIALKEIKPLLAAEDHSTRLAAYNSLRFCTSAEAMTFMQTVSADSTAQLRRQFATQLKFCHPKRHQQTILKLAADSDFSVQSALLKSIAYHPEQQQEAALWTLWKHGFWDVRLKATERLIEMGYSRQQLMAQIQNDASQRQQFVAQMTNRHPWLKVIHQTPLQSQQASDPSSSKVKQQIHALLSQWLIASTPQAKKELETQLQIQAENHLAEMEQVIQDFATLEQHQFINQLLAPEIPLYNDLQNLGTSLSQRRRESSRAIAAESQKRSLPEFVRTRLVTHLEKEHDRIIWNDILFTLSTDQTPEYKQAVLQAIGSRWADLRLLGCRHLQSMIEPEDCAALLPLLEDESRSVRLEAIRVLGYSNSKLAIHGMQLPDQESRLTGLSPLTSHPDQEIRFAAIKSLAKLNDANAKQLLVNQLHETDRLKRYHAIQACRQLQAQWSVQELLTLLWSETDHENQRQLLKSLEEITAAFDSPPKVASNLSLSDQIDMWRKWSEDAMNRPSTASAPQVLR